MSDESCEKVYLDGRIIPADAATVSVSDAGLLHGFSTFTTMLAHKGVIFRLRRHVARLMDTAALLSIRCEHTAESLADAAYAVLDANELQLARMRITLTPGSVRADTDEKPTTLITAQPLGTQPDWWYEKGVGVTVSSFRQLAGDPTFGHKTGCYLTRVLARKEAIAKGAQEALWFTTTNRLAEACFNNVFLVLGGTVFTPALDTPVLPGVVREAVIEVCGSLEIACDDRSELAVREMLNADEVFLTGSCSGVRPVVRIERHAVGAEQPGPITQRIMKAYRQLLERECKAR